MSSLYKEEEEVDLPPFLKLNGISLDQMRGVDYKASALAQVRKSPSFFFFLFSCASYCDGSASFQLDLNITSYFL